MCVCWVFVVYVAGYKLFRVLSFFNFVLSMIGVDSSLLIVVTVCCVCVCAVLVVIVVSVL